MNVPLMVAYKLHGERFVNYMHEDSHSEDCPCDYLEGKFPPHYPLPCLIGDIDLFDNYVFGVFIIPDCDESFDPVYTWDCVNGQWPLSLNNR